MVERLECRKITFEIISKGTFEREASVTPLRGRGLKDPSDIARGRGKGNKNSDPDKKTTKKN